MNKKLSIIIPVFNEANTIQLVLERIKNTILINNIKKEIVLVNDGSNDHTEKEIYKYIKATPELDILLVNNPENKGKGAAVRTGIGLATGQYIIIQDADLEYNPNDYNLLIKPLEDGIADVVYGSRYQEQHKTKLQFIWHTIANKALTFFSNIINKTSLTDMETCYKLFKAEVIKSIHIKENRFGFEPEVTAKIAKIPGIKIYEVPISYHRRSYGEGKKIGWIDGLRAIYCIIKYGLFR
jgi:glycosyltransferase involved in cell wall biosynthesis